jgi:hypothetical protein
VTPVNCACGETAKAKATLLGEFRIGCSDCGWAVIKPTNAEAVEAWNRVMRPRPTVTFDGHTARLFGNMIGEVYWRLDDYCALTDACETSHTGAIGDCRAWLIEKLTAAGFEVRASEGTSNAND